MGRVFLLLETVGQVGQILYAIFWLKIFPAWIFVSPMAGGPPLRVADWEQLQLAGRGWVELCRGEVCVPTREQRLAIPAARGFWATIERPRHQQGIAVGAQPCECCAEVTHSWCEACTERPWGPVCSACDNERRVCKVCQEAGRTWESVRQPAEDVIEVLSFIDEEGRLIELPEPIRIPRQQYDLAADSGRDPHELITEAIRAYCEAHGCGPEGDRGGSGT